MTLFAIVYYCAVALRTLLSACVYWPCDILSLMYGGGEGGG